MARCAAAGLVLVLALALTSSARAATFSADASLVPIAPAVGPAGLAAGDLDGDAIPDLATADVGSLDAALLRNDGIGNFAPLPCVAVLGAHCQGGLLTPVGSNPQAVGIADLNGDGQRDVVVTDINSDPSLAGVNVFTRNADAATNPDGSYSLSQYGAGGHTFPSTVPTAPPDPVLGGFAGVGVNPVAVAAGDLNGDGKVDLAVVNNVSATTGKVTLLTRTSAVGPGTTVRAADYTATSFTTAAISTAVAIGDLNGDGLNDVAVADSGGNATTGKKVTVLFQGPGGSFTTVQVNTPTIGGGGPATVAIGDLNGDGINDIVVTGKVSNNVLPLFKNSTGTGFTAGTPMLAAPVASGVAIGDLDGDGRNDIAVSNTTSNSVQVFLKDATGTTYTSTTLTTGAGPTAIAIADLAGNGKLDVVTANVNDGSGLTLLTNATPQGTTTSLQSSPAAGNPTSVTATVAKVVSGLRGSSAPTGTVTFTVDGTPGAPVALAGDGTASLSTSSLPSGSHTVQADYSGDANYAASTKSTSISITATADPPVAVTGLTSGVTATSATFSGTVDANGLDAGYVFEYGTSLAFGSISTPDDAGAGADPVGVSATVSGLTPNTTYYVRLVATTSAGTSFGAVQSFHSGGPALMPSAVTHAVTSTTNTSAGLAGTVNPNGQSTAFTFEYGTSTSFGNITPVVQLDDAFGDESLSTTLGGLNPNTTYYYRIVATNVAGTAVGAVQTFNTGPGGAPNVSTGAASSVTATGATLAGLVDANGFFTSYTFEYGTTNAFGSISAVASAGSNHGLQPVSLPVTGLTPGKVYRYRIVATNSLGTTAGTVGSFTTAAT